MRSLTQRDGYRWVIGPAGSAVKVPVDLFSATGEPPAEVGAYLDLHAPPRRYAVTVLTSQDCTMRCPYCIQNVSAQPVQRLSAQHLDGDDVTDIIQYVRGRAADLKLPVALLLFGGEPLMAPRACLDLLTGIAPDAGAVWTNGTLLTPTRIDPLVDAGLDSIHVTFDGGRETHDRTRSNLAGRGTYDLVLNNVLTTAARHPHLNWTVRSSLLPGSADTHLNLLSDLADLPRHSTFARFSLGVIDDIGAGFDDVSAYTPAVAAQMTSVNQAARAAGFHVGVATPLTECVFCSDPNTGVTIDVDGGLYPCWQAAGRTERRVGDVRTGLDPQLVNSRWAACDYNVRPHGDPASQTAFWDAVDQDILDARPQS